MNPLTSMFDFECRIRLDKRYVKLAIYAHRTAGWDIEANDGREAGTIENARLWIETWLKEDGAREESCAKMIHYLNCRMVEMKDFSEQPMRKNKSIVIPNYGPEFHPCTCGCSLLLDINGDEVGVDPNFKQKRTGA